MLKALKKGFLCILVFLLLIIIGCGKNFLAPPGMIVIYSGSHSSTSNAKTSFWPTKGRSIQYQGEYECIWKLRKIEISIDEESWITIYDGLVEAKYTYLFDPASGGYIGNFYRLAIPPIPVVEGTYKYAKIWLDSELVVRKVLNNGIVEEKKYYGLDETNPIYNTLTTYYIVVERDKTIKILHYLSNLDRLADGYLSWDEFRSMLPVGGVVPIYD